MGFVLRRSLPSITGLLALVLAVGVAAVIWAGAPVWFPAALAIAPVSAALVAGMLRAPESPVWLDARRQGAFIALFVED